MIFKVKFPDREEFVQAKNLKKMQDGYKEEIGDDFCSVISVTIIDPEVAKTIMLKSNEPELIENFSLFDACVGDDFCVIGSTDWVLNAP